MNSPKYTGLFGQIQPKTPSCPITKSFDSLSSTLLYIIISMFITYIIFSIWDNFERYSLQTIRYKFPKEKPSQLDIIEKKINHILISLEEKPNSGELKDNEKPNSGELKDEVKIIEE